MRAQRGRPWIQKLCFLFWELGDFSHVFRSHVGTAKGETILNFPVNGWYKLVQTNDMCVCVCELLLFYYILLTLLPPWGEDHSVSLAFTVKSALEYLGAVHPMRWLGLVAVCHHCLLKGVDVTDPKLRRASKLNGGRWWSLVFYMFCRVVPIFATKKKDGPSNFSRLTMASWRPPSIWGVQIAVLVWPHAWRWWDLCHLLPGVRG